MKEACASRSRPEENGWCLAVSLWGAAASAVRGRPWGAVPGPTARRWEETQTEEIHGLTVGTAAAKAAVGR